LQSVVGTHPSTVASSGAREADRVVKFHVFGQQKFNAAATTAAASRFENVQHGCRFDVIVFAKLYEQYVEPL
jgi:ribonuclease D